MSWAAEALDANARQRAEEEIASALQRRASRLVGDLAPRRLDLRRQFTLAPPRNAVLVPVPEEDGRIAVRQRESPYEAAAQAKRGTVSLASLNSRWSRGDVAASTLEHGETAAAEPLAHRSHANAVWDVREVCGPARVWSAAGCDGHR